MRSITILTIILALGLTACPSDKAETETDAAATSNAATETAGSSSGTTGEPGTTTTPTTTGVTDSGTTAEPGTTTSSTTAQPGTTTSGTTAEPGTTGGTTGGGGDESPYNACKTDDDCAPGALCISSANTMNSVKGNFCSPACDGDMCPNPEGGVDASQGALCLLGPSMGMGPSNCAVVCEIGVDDCGPTSECEDIGIPMSMGVGVCSHPA